MKDEREVCTCNPGAAGVLGELEEHAVRPLRLHAERAELERRHRERGRHVAQPLRQAARTVSGWQIEGRRVSRQRTADLG